MPETGPEGAHSPWKFLETQPGLLGSCAVHGKTLRPFRVNGYVAHTVDEYTWMFTCVKLNSCRRISKMFTRNFFFTLTITCYDFDNAVVLFSRPFAVWLSCAFSLFHHYVFSLSPQLPCFVKNLSRSSELFHAHHSSRAVFHSSD